MKSIFQVMTWPQEMIRLEIMQIFKNLIVLWVVLTLFFTCLHQVSAQEANPVKENILEGDVIEILVEELADYDVNQQSLFQKLKVYVTKGTREGENITVEANRMLSSGEEKYKLGDSVMISESTDYEGQRVFYIIDYVRRVPLFLLFSLFSLIVVAVGRSRGISSLVGLAVSFLIIFNVILPLILKGLDPILVAVLGGFLIVITTFYLSHGFNSKTTIAVVGTVISIFLTGLIALYFVNTAKLTGFASEEAIFLQTIKQGNLNIKGLLLAGILIGTLGVLDDITISQAAIVKELKKANPKMKPSELFFRAMNVGKDHIASLVNTLILVYAGSSLPLLLLFVVDSSRTYSEIINYQVLAEEIVRTLVGSIGLVLAVPVTTFIASRYGFQEIEK